MSTSNPAQPSSTGFNSTAPVVTASVTTTTPVIYPACTTDDVLETITILRRRGGPRLATQCVDIFLVGDRLSHATIFNVACECFILLPEKVARQNCSCQVPGQVSVFQLWQQCQALAGTENQRRLWLMHACVTLSENPFVFKS